jgi:hypothetical protein
VPLQDFLFALAVSGGTSRDMLRDLTARVLAHIGQSAGGARTLADDLQAAVTKATAGGMPVTVRFQGRDGRLHIVVSSAAGEIWQTSREIS